VTESILDGPLLHKTLQLELHLFGQCVLFIGGHDFEHEGVSVPEGHLVLVDQMLRLDLEVVVVLELFEFLGCEGE